MPTWRYDAAGDIAVDHSDCESVDSNACTERLDDVCCKYEWGVSGGVFQLVCRWHVPGSLCLSPHQKRCLEFGAEFVDATGGTPSTISAAKLLVLFCLEVSKTIWSPWSDPCAWSQIAMSWNTITQYIFGYEPYQIISCYHHIIWVRFRCRSSYSRATPHAWQRFHQAFAKSSAFVFVTLGISVECFHWGLPVTVQEVPKNTSKEIIQMQSQRLRLCYY